MGKARRPQVHKIRKVQRRGFLEVVEEVKISLMSSDDIRVKSSGEVKIGQTLDMRTLKPVENGLLCERIFGPTEFGCCACGLVKSKNGVTCPVCNVKSGDTKLRRKRFGHVELSAPVVHPWFRSIVSTVLGIAPRKFDMLVECDAYIVQSPGNSHFERGAFVSAREFCGYLQENPGDRHCGALNGGALMRRLLRKVKLDVLEKRLRREDSSPSVNRRLMLVRDMRKSGIKVEWMVMDALPVLPADLRPLLLMEDGTMADSDLNELYAKVINRSTRLRRMAGLGAPEIVLNAGRKGLQHAVDGLLAKGHDMKNRSGKKVLKPLESFIESKYGRLRRNLLGKRVDYSGRSVIVAGPYLKLHECGLPVLMAIELFKPFVIGRLIRGGLASSMKHAKLLCDMMDSAAMEALEEEMRERVVLLNRAPSLHRMSFQGFFPRLVDGKALALHPLACGAFNADFDGDQMGVHLPVTVEAQVEAQMLMLSVNNIISPASGKLALGPSQDIVLGIYYLTKDFGGQSGEGMVFSDMDDAVHALDVGVIDLNARIKVRVDGGIVDTTVGRCIFRMLFPDDVAFRDVNKTMKKKDLGKLLESCFRKYGRWETARLLDKVKDTGYKYATISGISFGMGDITVPRSKEAILAKAEEDVADIRRQFEAGVLSEKERYNKVLDTWTVANSRLVEDMMANFGVSDYDLPEAERQAMKEANSLFMMADSGARGSVDQMSQLAGMRGLMAKPTGEIVEIPIKHNLLEGLSYFEYLLACHGARKGRADGALKTANAGYFTRRLVDVANGVIINALDCGTSRGLTVGDLKDKDVVIQGFEERVVGRLSTSTVLDPETKEVIVERGQIVAPEVAVRLKDAGFDAVNVRSPITCELRYGICASCYGNDLSSGRLPDVGEAVGIIAAQSIGEPGTQLTLRTFHSGGKASGGAEQTKMVAPVDGDVVFKDVVFVRGRGDENVVVNKKGKLFVRRGVLLKEVGRVRHGAVLAVGDGQHVSKGDVLASWDGFSFPLVCANSGAVRLEGFVRDLTVKEDMDLTTGTMRVTVVNAVSGVVPKIFVGDREYVVPVGALVMAKGGDEVVAGDVVAKVPRDAQRNVDITKGLTRVLDVLEVRKARTYATMVEIDGEVTVGKVVDDNVLVSVANDIGVVREYKVPVGVQLNFQSGDQVSAGDLLFDGMVSVEDVLNVHGSEACARFVVDEVQKVYKAQGVETNDKHLEIMVRRMMEKVRIADAGDTEFVAGEIVPLRDFLEVNGSMAGRKATARRVILGLAASARLADSWLSSASFERTGRVLAESAVRGRVDVLKGTKENIIVGNLVPVGTGHEAYRNIVLKAEERKKENKRVKEARKLFEALFKK